MGGGKSRTLLHNNFVVAVVNIVLGLVLIPRFGLLGTAFAALGGVVLLHTLVFIEVGVGFGAYPFDRTILKPLAAAAARWGSRSSSSGTSPPRRSASRWSSWAASAPTSAR